MRYIVPGRDGHYGRRGWYGRGGDVIVVGLGVPLTGEANYVI